MVAPASRPLLTASGQGLLFRFLMHGVRLTPLAVLLHFYLARNKLSVLAGPVVDACALRTREFYELIL
ncbi:MAG: hypothetical protein G01um10148_489 [Parcubacteria group bacterium Gr01-1014_8]|nr:MAG: hypothetical protein G01um10148_489 [Parcubacteria group bacterium Gr01-1014_8]